MRGVYQQTVNQDCTAYQAFKNLVTDRAENKGTLSVQKTDGKLTGLQCAHHRFFHSQSGYDRKAMVELRQEFFSAICDEIESDANIQKLFRGVTGEKFEELKRKFNSVVEEFRKCILPDDRDANLDFQRTDMERIIKNVEELKTNLSVDVLLEMDAKDLARLAEDQGLDAEIFSVKKELETIKSFSETRDEALGSLDSYMPKNVEKLRLVKDGDPLLNAGMKLLNPKIFPDVKAHRELYNRVLEKHGILSLQIGRTGCLEAVKAGELTVKQAREDLQKLVNDLETIAGTEKFSAYFGELDARNGVKACIDAFIAEVKAIPDEEKKVTLENSRLAATPTFLGTLDSTTLHDVGSRFGRQLKAAVNGEGSAEQRKAAIVTCLREFAAGMFDKAVLDPHAEQFKAIADKLSDPKRGVDFFDGFAQAVDLLETCKGTLDRPVDKARCERKIKAFKEGFVGGRGDLDLSGLSGADRGTLAALGLGRAAAKGQKALTAFLKETFNTCFSALDSGGDEGKKALKDALKLLPHIALDLFKDEQKFDYAVKKLETCFTQCTDRLDGESAVALRDFLSGFVEKIRGTRTEWKGDAVQPTVTASQLKRLGELAAFACGGEGDQGGYMGIVDGRIVKFLTHEGERKEDPFAEFEKNRFAKTLFKQSANNLKHQLVTLIKGCSLEAKDAVQKLLDENAEGKPRGETPLERTTIVEILKVIAKDAVSSEGVTFKLDDIQPAPPQADTSLKTVFHLEGIKPGMRDRACQIRRLENLIADKDYRPQGKLDVQSKSELVKGASAEVETQISMNPYSSRIGGSTGTVWNIVGDDEDADVYLLDCADISYFGGWIFNEYNSQEEQVVQDTVPTLSKDLQCNGEIGERTEDGRLPYARLNAQAGWIGRSELQGSDSKQMDHTIGFNLLAGAAPSFVFNGSSNDKRGNLIYFLTCQATVLGNEEAAKMLQDLELKPDAVAQLSEADKLAYDARQQKLEKIKDFIGRFYDSEDVRTSDKLKSLFMLLMFGGKNCGFDLMGDDTQAEFAKFLEQAKRVDQSLVNDAHENYLKTMRETFKGWFQSINAKHDLDPENRDRPLYLVIAAVGTGAFENSMEDIASSFAEAAIRSGGKIRFVFPNWKGQSKGEVSFRAAFDRAYYKLLREKVAERPDEVAFNIIESLKAINGQPKSAADMDTGKLRQKVLKEMSVSVETLLRTFCGDLLKDRDLLRSYYGEGAPKPELLNKEQRGDLQKELLKLVVDRISRQLSEEASFDAGISELRKVMRNLNVTDDYGQPSVGVDACHKFLDTLEEFSFVGNSKLTEYYFDAETERERYRKLMPEIVRSLKGASSPGQVDAVLMEIVQAVQPNALERINIAADNGGVLSSITNKLVSEDAKTRIEGLEDFKALLASTTARTQSTTQSLIMKHEFWDVFDAAMREALETPLKVRKEDREYLIGDNAYEAVEKFYGQIGSLKTSRPAMADFLNGFLKYNFPGSSFKFDGGDDFVRALTDAEQFDAGLRKLYDFLYDIHGFDDADDQLTRNDGFLTVFEQKLNAPKEASKAEKTVPPEQKTLAQIAADLELENVNRQNVYDEPSVAAKTVGDNITTILEGEQSDEEKASSVGSYLKGLYLMLFEETQYDADLIVKSHVNEMVARHLNELETVAGKLSKARDEQALQEGVVQLRNVLLQATERLLPEFKMQRRTARIEYTKFAMDIAVSPESED